MIAHFQVCKPGEQLSENIDLDQDENKENFYYDLNAQGATKKEFQNLDREFGTDLTNFISNEASQDLNSNSSLFPSLNKLNLNEINQKQSLNQDRTMLATVSKENPKKIFHLVKDNKASWISLDDTKPQKKIDADTKITEFCKKKKKNANIFPMRENNNSRIKYLNSSITSLPQIVENPVEITLNDGSMISSTIRNTNRHKTSDNSSVSFAYVNYFRSNNNFSECVDRINFDNHKVPEDAFKMKNNLLKNNTNSTGINEERIRHKEECKITLKFLVFNYLSQNQRENFFLKYSPINEYIEDIYINLKDEERLKLLDHNKIYPSSEASKKYLGYMSHQTDINKEMRAILIDWLVATHLKFEFRTRTLFLTVSIIDRYLSKEVTHRSKLQLLGVTSLYIACKHEEIDTPPGIQFAHATDNAYTKEEILQMENIILEILNFEIMTPTPIQFYEIICLFLSLNAKEICFGRYLMESFMIEYKSTFYTSSLIAISTVYLVLKFFRIKNYHIIFSEFFNSNSNYIEVKDCAKEICNFNEASSSSSLRAVKNKFGQRDEHEVSIIYFGK